MLAVDTNVIIRFLVGDDEARRDIAKTLIGVQDVMVPISVLLEVEWVLRSYYRFDREKVLHALRALAGLRKLTLQNRSAALRHSLVGWRFGFRRRASSGARGRRNGACDV